MVCCMPGFPRAPANGPSTNPRSLSRDGAAPGHDHSAMHLVLTDRLCCPRCGPAFGLILLAHEVRERRVLEGDLGCPGCQGRFPVRDGFADLRVAPGDAVPARPSGEESQDDVKAEALRLAAALGVTEGPGTLLMKGPAAGFAGEVAGLVGGIEVVAMDEALVEEEEEEGVSRMAADSPFPFLPSSFRGVVLSGELGDSDLSEAGRVLAPPGRLVALEPFSGLGEAAQAWGMTVVLEEEGILVARKDDPGTPPLVTLRGLRDPS